MRHKLYLLTLSAILTASVASAATFGRVVPTGGPAADIALDEGRGVLYIANYTSSRIDVMSVADYSISRSITVAAYPGGLAVSPDGHYLVVTHYASSGGTALTKPGQDAVTIIDLANNNQRRTFGLSSGPVGVAFGIDGMALILTQTDFLLLNPASGATTNLGTVANVSSSILPVDQNTFPPQILAGSLMATADGSHIFGIGGTTPDTGGSSQVLLFSYRVANRSITAARQVTSTPSLAPRVLSVSRDGSYYMTGWALIQSGAGFQGDRTANGPLIAQWPGANSVALNIGSIAIRSSRNLIYGQIEPGSAPPSSTSESHCFDNGICVTVTTPGNPNPTVSSAPPNLLVMDSDNLSVRERIQIPEKLAGKSIFNSDESVLYSISDSGVTVFPMTQFDKAPRVTVMQEDVVFRGNFCNAGALTQTIDIVDPSGAAVPFQIQAAAGVSAAGITISPSSGVTPARVKITVDPSLIRSMIGTNPYKFEVLSASAVNMPRPPSRGALESTYKTNVRSRFRLLINNREPENRGAFLNVPGQLVDVLADPARNRFYVLRQDTNQVLVFDATSYSQIATLRTGNTPTQMAITFDRGTLMVANNDSQIANRYDLNSLQQLAPIVFQGGHYPRSIAASGKAILAASRVAGPVNTIDQIDLTTLTASPLPSLGPYKNDISVSTTLVAAPNGSTIFAAMPDGRMLLYNANVDAFTVSRKDANSLKAPLAASSFGAYVVDHNVLNESLVTVAPLVSPSDTTSGFAFVDQGGYITAVSTASHGFVQNLKADQSQTPLPTMMVEAPLVSDDDYPFQRTLAPLADRSAIISLTTSGFTVLPWNFDAATAVPILDRLVNAADFTKPVAPGGLVSLFGQQLSPMTLVSTDVPLPTVLADSCLTANGVVIPMVFVSPTQINAQLPFQVSGNTDIVLRTPGGTSDALHIVILPAAPAVFHSGTAGPITGIPTVVRATNGELATNSNPLHPNDRITIYLTGMGQTSPAVETGAPAPSDPLSSALLPATVSLGGTNLFIDFAGLVPGGVGLYQINALIPFKGVPTGFDIPLTISQGGGSTTIPVRVVN